MPDTALAHRSSVTVQLLVYGTLTSFSLKISTGMKLSDEQCLAINNSNNLNVCQIVELVDVTFALYSRLCELISEQGLSVQQVLPRVLLRLDSSLFFTWENQ